MRCGTIGSCQSAATSEIVKALLVTSLTRVSGAVASVQIFTFTFIRPKIVDALFPHFCPYKREILHGERSAPPCKISRLSGQRVAPAGRKNLFFDQIARWQCLLPGLCSKYQMALPFDINCCGGGLHTASTNAPRLLKFTVVTLCDR